jgi:hypothetical protein
LAVLPGLLLPVRIGRVLSVWRLLPVVAHADKISAEHDRAQSPVGSVDAVVVMQFAEWRITEPTARWGARPIALDGIRKA